MSKFSPKACFVAAANLRCQPWRS